MVQPKTGAPEWNGQQASPWNSVNETLFVHDVLGTRAIIEDRNLNSPPVSAASGDA